ncbi:uncharacterized protein LOC121136129 [Mesocricetus auratus]|uniref:Uncharacterized protein LOC121136129 n=1 Tax=Mesocricetus auratus TaxID=10036 RepID=A0ABM2WLQ8_MESAU|nr:uncharacterized protein LOC121136129 [Mesocricetus auratus]
MPEEIWATWTKWLPYAGSSRILPPLEAILARSLFLVHRQVAQVCPHLSCPQCPKDSSMEPLCRMEWLCYLTLSLTHLRWSTQWWQTYQDARPRTQRPWYIAFERLPPECSDLLMQEYMGDVEDPKNLPAQFRELMEDFTFVIPALQVAYFQCFHAPVYIYEFQHQSSFIKNKDARPSHVRADHGDHAVFVFGSDFWGSKRESSLFLLSRMEPLMDS